METKYLIKIDPYANNNKYYRMVVNGDTWTAEYGRVGATPQKRTYKMSSFTAKYNEKIAKGYEDKTDLHEVVTKVVTVANSYKDIEDDSIRKIINKLLLWADETIKANYTVSAEAVTQDAVDKAQDILNRMADSTLTVQTFNNYLQELYAVIPRRMGNVYDTMAASSADFDEIVVREQALLDTMGGQVTRVSKGLITNDRSGKTDGQTILEANGLKVRKCDDDELENIKKHLDPETRRRFLNAWHAENEESRKRFDAYCEKEKIGRRGIKLLYHGSRNCNYWNIMKTSLKIRPTVKVTRAGAMFGQGLYFAPKAAKSVGYTDSGFWAKRTGSSTDKNNTVLLMVFKVAMGKSMDVHSWSSSCSTMNEQKIKNAGYNSLFAHAGVSLRNDECIVYNDDACTLSYIIELSN